eukprot:scaffold39018_cov60-Phaeocystis_antarctica.AAC.4
MIVLTTDRVDLAAGRGGRESCASTCHVGKRLPAIRLGIVHGRRAKNNAIVTASAHDIDLAIKGHARVTTPFGRHA